MERQAKVKLPASFGLSLLGGITLNGYISVLAILLPLVILDRRLWKKERGLGFIIQELKKIRD